MAQDSLTAGMAQVSALDVPQNSQLLARYRHACSRPQCDLLCLGVERCAVQFGPVVVSTDSESRGTYIVLLGVLTNEDGSLRARDGLLVGDGSPHLLVLLAAVIHLFR